MTYNVFGGTLNLAQSNPIQSNPIQCHWAVWGTTYPALLRPVTHRRYNKIHNRLSTLKFCFLYSLLLQTVGYHETFPLTLVFSLSPKYYFVLLTDDDSDVDE